MVNMGELGSPQGNVLNAMVYYLLSKTLYPGSCQHSKGTSMLHVCEIKINMVCHIPSTELLHVVEPSDVNSHTGSF